MTAIWTTAPFTWQDGERTIRYGRGQLATAGELLGEGYVLLTTARARESAPDVVSAAAHVHELGHGFVEEEAGAVLPSVPDDASLIVALGGGRVVDAAKAVAAARGVRAAAIPTTLSAAEMTKGHRRIKGHEAKGGVRPAIVLNDPALCGSQPPAALAASAANSLAHAVESACTRSASPVPRMASLEALRLTADAYAGADEDPDEGARDRLALAAVLSGYTIDTTHYGLHHVLSQTLVRGAGVGHGPANAAMLPHTAAALARRAPELALGGAEDLAWELARRASAERLRDLGVAHDALSGLADTAAKRPDLDETPPRADREELLALYEAAW